MTADADARYWVLADDRTGHPRVLLRTGSGGILWGSIDRWDPETGEWDWAGGYLEGRLKGLGGDSDDPDEIDAANLPAVMAALTNSIIQHVCRDCGVTILWTGDRWLGEDGPYACPSGDGHSPKLREADLVAADKAAAAEAGVPYVNDYALDDPF